MVIQAMPSVWDGSELNAINPLSDLIVERSRRHRSHAYLIHAREDRSLTWQDLDLSAAVWADQLSASGVPRGATIGLAIADPLTFAAAYLGTMASGRWSAPLDPGAPMHGLGGLGQSLAQVQADVVVSDRPIDGTRSRGRLELLSGGPLHLATTASTASTASTDEITSVNGFGPTGGAVLASSGTTGAPKLIPLPQALLLQTAANVVRHHELSPKDRGFSPLPLFHINAEVVGLLSALVAGSELVLDDRFHRTDFWHLMECHGVTWINAVPAIISRLTRLGEGERIPAGIRFVRSASAPLPAATLEAFEASTGLTVLETYGMTEAGSQITANPLHGTRKVGSVGMAVGVELRIVADVSSGDDRVVADSTGTGGTIIGHVEIKGPSVITEYGGGNHADRFDADGWLRTGDLGHFDEDGYLFLDARSDDVINRGGEKVFPREIEEVILTDPQVASAVVVGAPDDELGQVPVGYLVLRDLTEFPDGTPSRDDLARMADVVERIALHLESAMVRQKRPASLRVIAAVPTGLNGKIQRRRLHDAPGTVLYQR